MADDPKKIREQTETGSARDIGIAAASLAATLFSSSGVGTLIVGGGLTLAGLYSSLKSTSDQYKKDFSRFFTQLEENKRTAEAFAVLLKDNEDELKQIQSLGVNLGRIEEFQKSFAHIQGVFDRVKDNPEVDAALIQSGAGALRGLSDELQAAKERAEKIVAESMTLPISEEGMARMGAELEGLRLAEGNNVIADTFQLLTTVERSVTDPERLRQFQEKAIATVDAFAAANPLLFEELSQSLPAQAEKIRRVRESLAFRQSGGPLNGNQIALVGEKGPELFIPDRPGLILSNEDSKRFMGAFADGGIVGAGLAAFSAFQGGGGGLGGLAAAFQAGNAELGGGGLGGGLEGLGGILGENGILGGPLFGTDEQGNPLTLEGVLSAQSDLFQGLLDQKTLFDGLFLEQETAHQGEMDAAAQEGQQGRLQKTKQSGSALSAAIGVSQQLSESLMQSGSKKMFAVGKALAISNAVMDTFRGAQAAFTAYANLWLVGPIIGAAAAGATIAAGIQRINQIRSQKFGGGGAVGGAGGNVPRPSIGAPAGPGGGTTPELPQQQQAGPPQRNIAISITSDRGVVTTDWIRDQLIPSLNNALGDGVQIDVTATRQLT